MRLVCSVIYEHRRRTPGVRRLSFNAALRAKLLRAVARILCGVWKIRVFEQRKRERRRYPTCH